MLLGIDVGTTAVKALLVDDEAHAVAEAGVEYGISNPRPGWSEQNAEDWWTSVVAAARQVVAEAGGDNVRALAVSTQGDTMVPVDGSARPLAPARTWMDTRAADLVPPLEAALSPRDWQKMTGARMGPYAAAMTIVWLREHLPEVYRRTARFAMVEDFIIERLTGAATLDHPNASRTLMFDIHSRSWSPKLLELIGVEEERLSRALPSGALAGELTSEAAGALGLPAGIPVALGGHDQTCAAVGAGVVRPGTVLLSCGTAWVLLASVDQPLLDKQFGVHTYCHAARGRWALLTAHAGGNILTWLRETLYQGDNVGYDEIVHDARRAQSDGREEPLLLPHFYGAGSSDAMRHAKGVLLGLTLSSTRDDLALAVLRGVALEALRNFNALRAMGAPTHEIRMIGGGARSDLWAQMIADATGIALLRPEVREAAAYGAAILAGVACGLFPSVDDVVSNLPIRDRISPDPNQAEVYARLLARVEEALTALGPVWNSAAS